MICDRVVFAIESIVAFGFGVLRSMRALFSASWIESVVVLVCVSFGFIALNYLGSITYFANNR